LRHRRVRRCRNTAVRGVPGSAAGAPESEAAEKAPPGRQLRRGAAPAARRKSGSLRRTPEKGDLEVEGLEAVAAAPADVKVSFGRRRPDLPVLVEDEVVVAKVLQPVGAVEMSSIILESIRKRAFGRRPATKPEGSRTHREGRMVPMPRAPALFVAHGSPTFGLDAGEFGNTLRRFGRRIPRPDAIVVASAHWEAPWPIRVTAAARPPLIYDFGGFPRALYELQYPAPGSPSLAAEVVRLLSENGLPAAPDPRRGWDHGVWIPLRLL